MRKETAGGTHTNLNDALKQREHLLSAVAYSAKALLSSGDWGAQIDEILRQLGEASDSSRVYVFQHEREGDKLLTTLAYEWCAPGISAQIQNPDVKRLEIGAVGFQRWIDLMSKGELIHGDVENFPADEQDFLKMQEIKSLVVIPFFVSGRWWGFIGFDQCVRVREWSSAELGALQAAASMLGSAIERRDSEVLMEIQFNELQKTNHELDFFVYSVSHDLRAPLLSILGLINIAEKENISKSQHEYFSMIKRSVNKLDNFIKEILDYSRNSRIKPQNERIEFSKLIDDICTRLIPADAMHLFKVTYNISDAVEFYSDKKRLDIIFNNLMSNALKFRDANKSQSLISIDIESNNSGCKIIFEDNGIGIEEHHLQNIFNMFYRATESATGSGLGLYITREVVNKLGGSINVESVYGEFTRFICRIPNQKPKNSESGKNYS